MEALLSARDDALLRGTREFHPRVMPRDCALRRAGARDLRLAIARHGGHEPVADALSLWYFHDWKYLTELRYIVCSLRSLYDRGEIVQGSPIPSTTVLREKGYTTLALLLRRHGGTRSVGARLGLQTHKRPRGGSQEEKPEGPVERRTSGRQNANRLEWGALGLELADDLLRTALDSGGCVNGLPEMLTEQQLRELGENHAADALEASGLHPADLAPRLGLAPPHVA